MKNILIVTGFALVLAFILIITSQERTVVLNEVSASMFPLSDMVENIVSDNFTVKQVLKQGASPHAFELNASQIREYENTKILFSFGYGIDPWVEKIQNAWPEISVCQVGGGIEFIETSSEENLEHGGVNPHYWLSYENAGKIVDSILNCLNNAFPEYADSFTEDNQRYKQALRVSQEKTSYILKVLMKREIITFHDAFPYFAKEFNLKIVGTVEAEPGEEPTPGQLISLQKLVSQYDIPALFAEPQLSQESIEPFARDLGIEIYFLDPEGASRATSYIEMMEQNAATIVQAYTKKP